MASVLFLNDNSWVIKRGDDRDPITDDEGAVATGLTARCFFALGEEDAETGDTVPSDDPIHATLDNAAVPVTAGKLRAVFSGANITTHLGPLLDAAELINEALNIYERVIVAGSYNDHHVLRVERHRPAGT